MSATYYRRAPVLTMNDALRQLRKAGYQPEVLTHGTIVAHRGDVHLGFNARRTNAFHQPGYAKEPIDIVCQP